MFGRGQGREKSKEVKMTQNSDLSMHTSRFPDTPTLFCLVRACLLATMELSDCDRDCMASKAKNVYIWPFPEKVC